MARQLGVSPATVSMALRQHPRISLAMRHRVAQLAQDVGYRPDPEIGKLMRHLRERRSPAFCSTLCALTSWPEGIVQSSFVSGLVAAARERAVALGYGFDLVSFARERPGGRKLQEMLEKRGVEGLLLLPTVHGLCGEEFLMWGKFSVVATTPGRHAPEFDVVTADCYGNTHRLCRQLAATGYRRIGLIVEEAVDAAVNHCFSAGSWFDGGGAAGSQDPQAAKGNTAGVQCPDGERPLALGARPRGGRSMRSPPDCLRCVRGESPKARSIALPRWSVCPD